VIAVTIPGFTAESSVRGAYGVFPAQVDPATCAFECRHECADTCRRNPSQCQKCRNRCMNICLCVYRCTTRRYCDEYGATIEVETCEDCEGNEWESQRKRISPECVV
jgi:hypothetical protein